MTEIDFSNPKQTCFIICPISDPGTPTRIRSDQIRRHIIEPAVAPFNYQTLRSDDIAEPGLITNQVIQHLIEDPLVIADLSELNPNVFYELAVRHAAKKPFIQIIDITTRIPFDVSTMRAIQVDHHDLDSAADCRSQIKSQIQAIQQHPDQVESPLSAAINLQHLLQSADPKEVQSGEVLLALQVLSEKIDRYRPRASYTLDPAMDRFFRGRLFEVQTLSRRLAAVEATRTLGIQIEHNINLLLEILDGKVGMTDAYSSISFRTSDGPLNIPNQNEGSHPHRDLMHSFDDDGDS